MRKLKNLEDGFTLIEALLVLAVLALVGVTGWLAYQRHGNANNNVPVHSSTSYPADSTSGWSTYTNTCFQYSFKAPSNLKVNLIEKPALGVSCGLSPTDTGSHGVNDWAEVSADIGNSYVESLPKGPYISIGTPLPINNPTAMQFGGLQTARSVTDVINSVVSSAVKDSSASIITINSHKAAVVETINPNDPPSNFRTVDTPYCPCTSEAVTIDTGADSVIQVSGSWLNSDKQSGQIMNTIVDSITFFH